MKIVRVFDGETLQFVGTVELHDSATDEHVCRLIHNMWRNCGYKELFFETDESENNRVYVYPLNETRSTQ